jgi:hypothetical protein
VGETQYFDGLDGKAFVRGERRAACMTDGSLSHGSRKRAFELLEFTLTQMDLVLQGPNMFLQVNLGQRLHTSPYGSGCGVFLIKAS